MTIHEFGKGNQKTIVLIHPSMVMWDYFEYVIPLLEDKYHLIIPDCPVMIRSGAEILRVLNRS